MISININTSAIVKYTNKLEKMHRSALPVAIRSTLNSAAFDVKKDTMLKTAKESFTTRVPNFFRAYSKVEMAKGFDIKTMCATVGFTTNALKGGNNYSIKDLEQQEYGGTIRHRSFIPLDTARGGNNARPVRPLNRLSAINRVTNSSKSLVRGKNKQERFIKSAIHAGEGSYVIGNFGRRILWRIESITRINGRTVIKKKALYTFRENRAVSVKPTGFMRKASLISAGKMEKYYIREAQKQIKRLQG